MHLSSPRIYVRSLSDYNNAVLTGRWIDADQDHDDIYNDVQDMLAESSFGPAEEWAIHDYEGFEGLKIGEYESLERVSILGRGIAEHGDRFAAYVCALRELWGEDWFDEDELGKMEARTIGNFATVEDFAEYHANAFGLDDFLETAPESLRWFLKFDYEDYASALQSDYSIVQVEGGYDVFDMEAA
ncbi:antirestriction protein ArdA [Crossiella sp. CA198]|uniref:antirestriction protein ArdA n=1 Tax=Crossiella sp. CA198 TaxID=3455607 RepID=UPI003F8D41B2